MTSTVRSTALAAAFSLIAASLLVVGLPLQAPAAGCGDPAPPPNGDGNVSGADALYCLQMAVGSQPVDLTTCDADNSGTASASDALRILQSAVGQTVPLTCPGPPTTTTTSTTVTTTTTMGAPALTWTEIAAVFQAPILTGGCASSLGCHAVSTVPACPSCCLAKLAALGGYVLMTHADMVGIASSEHLGLNIVEPGNADASWLMDKLDAMPWVTATPADCLLSGLDVSQRCSDDSAVLCTSDGDCVSGTCETWCGTAMPPAPLVPFLPQEFRDGVRSWINSGAPNN
ncbi:MAG TPA: hypothetical protein EYG16_11360 [Deltaproteobacteria bacterium]|nr:hypothetical protein [Deltaproteobacteria bacterium]